MQLSKLVENLEEHLAMAEVQVNEIIKDVMAKKKVVFSLSIYLVLHCFVFYQKRSVSALKKTFN